MPMNKMQKNWHWYALAFAVPIALFVVFLMWSGIYPFGGISNFRDDLEIQYADYFAFYRNVLLGNGELSYSFTKSLGGPLVALWGYYLASPFNLLIVFFKPEQIQLFVFTITTLKLGLCGLTFYLFARYKFPKAQSYVLLFLSCAYAFTQYNVGQMANLNWLDGVYMLPLMLMGVTKYIREQKRTLFFVSTACSIIFNWYTGYMNCIFVMLYFLCEQCLADCQDKTLSIKGMFKKTTQFALLEILSVLLSMATFLPVLLGQAGGRTFAEGIFEFRTNGSLLEILNGFIIGSANPSRNITLFCSILLLLFATYFFWDKQIEKPRKIALGSLLGVMVASLFFWPLENIWCGFQIESSYAYRFLYLAILVLILMAGTVLEHFDALERKPLFQVTAGLIGLFLILDLLGGFDTKQLWVQLALLIIYCLLATVRKTARFKKTLAILCIFALFFGELSWNAKMVSGWAYTYDAAHTVSYIGNEQKLVNQIKASDPGFYRMEKTLNREYNYSHNSFYSNESMAFNTFGIQHYSSTYDRITADFIKNLGYSRDSFPSFYHAPILPADSLLGVKYLLSEKEYDGFLPLEGMSSYNEKVVYQNPYALPLAFSSSADILENTSAQATDAFDYMNQIYSRILGYDVTLFAPCTDYETVEKAGRVTYHFDSTDQDEILFVSLKATDLDVSLYWDDAFVTQYRTGWLNHDVLPLGNRGQTHQLRLDNLPQDGQVNIYSLRLSEFEGIIQAIQQQSHVSDIQVENGNVRLTTSGSQDGYVLLTIPYDEGWRITVNGQPVSAQMATDALTAIPVPQGEAVVTMDYQLKGVSAGIGLTVVSAVIFVAWQLKVQSKKKSLKASV